MNTTNTIYNMYADYSIDGELAYNSQDSGITGTSSTQHIQKKYPESVNRKQRRLRDRGKRWQNR